MIYIYYNNNYCCYTGIVSLVSIIIKKLCAFKCSSAYQLLFSVSNLFDRYIMNILVLIETGSRPDPECFLLKPVTCYYVHDHIIKRDPMLYTCYFAEIFVKIPGVYYGIPSPIFTCKIKTCL